MRLVADRDDGGQAGRSLGHNEVEPMNLTLEFGKMNVDGMALAEVCRRYSVKELSLFGSAARGEMRPESDVDIMVEFEQDARVGLIKFESLRRGTGGAHRAHRRLGHQRRAEALGTPRSPQRRPRHLCGMSCLS